MAFAQPLHSASVGSRRTATIAHTMTSTNANISHTFIGYSGAQRRCVCLGHRMLGCPACGRICIRAPDLWRRTVRLQPEQSAGDTLQTSRTSNRCDGGRTVLSYHASWCERLGIVEFESCIERHCDTEPRKTHATTCVQAYSTSPDKNPACRCEVTSWQMLRSTLYWCFANICRRALIQSHLSSHASCPRKYFVPQGLASTI